MKSPLLAAVLVIAGLGGAAPSHGQPAATATGGVAAPVVDLAAVLAHHAALVHANYEDAWSAARALQAAVAAFVAQPDAQRLEAARRAWLAAREPYGQTEAFRFYGGPIDAEGGPEGRLNSWPMDESFVDGVDGRPDAGLINDRRVEITKESLAGYNERGGEENIATGWHAIEFLLWGQDLRDDGPGDRSADDFVDGKAPNADRRRRYLQVVTDLLVDDLQGLVSAWAPKADNFRARFERGGLESLRKVFVGLGSLSRGELAGERLEVALASRDQEDEHSCFSDNTHRDVVANALGIENVWLGRYVRTDGTRLQGPGLRELVAAKDPALAERTTRQLAASVQAAQAIHAPFDREIADDAGRARIEHTIDSLVAQSKLLAQSAHALGIERLNLAVVQ